MARVLVIADNQCPFNHDDYLAFLLAVQKKHRTDTVVHVGDEVDLHAIGDYVHDPDGYSAGAELNQAIIRLKPYYKAFPEMNLCTSNHGERVLKLAFKNGIPKACIRELKQIIDAPKTWNWAQKWEIDGVIYKHGLGYSGAMGAINAAKDELASCVIGHLHADAGILYWSNGQKVLFGMNVGSGIDAKAYAFAYGRDCRKKPILSCGVVINSRPYLETMNLTVGGRWDGKV